MSPKIGRPPSENPRTINLKIRLNAYEDALLEECVKRSGKTKTEIVTEGIYEVAKSYGLLVKAIARENGSK